MVDYGIFIYTVIQLFIYTVRDNQNGGGGLALGVLNEIDCEPVLVSQGEQGVELIVIETNMNGTSIRFINGYGPQENESELKVREFYSKLDEEIVKAQNDSCEIIIEMDFNAKLGDEYVPGDPNKMSRNGQILANIIEERDLKVVNSSGKCKYYSCQTR